MKRRLLAGMAWTPPRPRPGTQGGAESPSRGSRHLLLWKPAATKLTHRVSPSSRIELGQKLVARLGHLFRVSASERRWTGGYAVGASAVMPRPPGNRHREGPAQGLESTFPEPHLAPGPFFADFEVSQNAKTRLYKRVSVL